MDRARNDLSLDPVVRLGANRAMFVLGKYYAKLDDCEVYPIAISTITIQFFVGSILTTFNIALDPTKTAKWFKRNDGWAQSWKNDALEKVHHRWEQSYKPKATSQAPYVPASSSYPEPESPSINVIDSVFMIIVII